MSDKVVYAWLNAGIPFYIGIGTLSRTKSKRDRNSHCLRKRIKAEKEGVFCIQILYSGLSWKEACKIECQLIQQYGRRDLGTGVLTNMTNGGDGLSGYSHTQETKKKLSESLKGKRWGKNNPNNSPVMTPDGFFDSTAEAARSLGCHQSTISRRAANINFPGYYLL